MDMAREYPEMNFLGLEIRRPCVEEAFKKMEKYGIKDNVHFVALNANVDIDRVVKDVQEHSEIVRCEYLLREEGGGRTGIGVQSSRMIVH